jgi:hypothetical protein
MSLLKRKSEKVGVPHTQTVALELHVDSTSYLPRIKAYPVLSQTGETDLVRRW